jgi:hypothetical protein
MEGRGMSFRILRRSQVKAERFHKDRVTFCAYCDASFPTDVDGATEAVTDHIYECPEHPMADVIRKYKWVEAENAKLKEQIETILSENRRLQRHAELMQRERDELRLELRDSNTFEGRG